MKFESLNNTSPENSLEKKQKLWDEKMAQLLVPDKYGYVLDEGMRQPVIALNLLGINTVQSDQGNYSERPWIEFGAKFPTDVYVGERELKQILLKEQGFNPLVMDESSPLFDRAKQVEIEDEARKQLSSAGYTPEFEMWRSETANMIAKLTSLISEFNQTRPKEEVGQSEVVIDFPYRDPKYDPYISEVPFVETRLRDQRSINPEDIFKILESNREEMRRFGEFLKRKFFSG
jgi:hypothetical protein